MMIGGFGERPPAPVMRDMSRGDYDPQIVDRKDVYRKSTFPATSGIHCASFLVFAEPACGGKLISARKADPGEEWRYFTRAWGS